MGSYHGWGIRGLAYALSWPGIAVSAATELTAELGPDDPRRALLSERVEQSRKVQAQLIAPGQAVVKLKDPVLVALGNDLSPVTMAYGRQVWGTPTIACPVFEDVEQVKANAHKLNEYDAVVVASQWNRDVLRELGIDAMLCHEGVDSFLFHPDVRKREKDGKFRVFSGGKAEYRKGQDIVIEAFRRFARTRDDAVLVASWGSPFSWSGQDFEGKWRWGAPPGLHIGKPNYHAWTQRAGIERHQFECLDPRPNWRMPEVYANIDVAVFPNRREGGTNFVAMEAIACGVPTFIRLGCGQDDLIGTGEFYNRIGDDAEIVAACVEAMTMAYEGTARGQTKTGSYWTWQRHCAEMAEIVRNV